ncbi:MAG: winged helix-turn-helix domain-containing protein [Candidatus Thermoplasmatota archaeon]|nr:winged helix-turn-helix domain-containing protein [Candidatus Thermoplasmatota archaeon]
MPQDRLEKLFDVMSSQTKSHIIALLAIGGKMTVTQISEHIKTSRSNLYQAISDLQEQGFVNPPEIVVRKNYVEKYYSLNNEAFNEKKAGELNEEFKKMSPDRLRRLMATFLLSQSLNLKVIAQEIMNVPDEDMMKAVEDGTHSQLSLSFSSLSDDSYSRVVEQLKPFMNYIDNPENFKKEDSKEKHEDDTNMVLVMAIPAYLLKSLRKSRKK